MQCKTCSVRQCITWISIGLFYVKCIRVIHSKKLYFSYLKKYLLFYLYKLIICSKKPEIFMLFVLDIHIY